MQTVLLAVLLLVSIAVGAAVGRWDSVLAGVILLTALLSGLNA